MNTKGYLLITLLYAIVNVANSQNDFQPGFVITTNLDTIHGFVNFKSSKFNSSKCEFAKAIEKDVKVYQPGEINSYGTYENKYYVSKSVEIDSVEQHLFLECLLEGIVKLYYYKDGQRLMFFIEKNETIYTLTNEELKYIDDYNTVSLKRSNRYKGILNILFNDSPDVYNKIKSVQYSPKSLVKISEDYHHSVCPNEECVIYAKDTKKTVYIEPLLAVNLASMGLKTSANTSTNVSAELGLNFRFVPNIGNQRWNVNLGLTYSKEKFEGEFINTIYSDKEEIFDIRLSNSVLRMPLVLDYNFNTKRYQPWLFAGISNAFILIPEYSILERIPGNVIYENERESVMRPYQLGLQLGAGLRYHLHNSNYIAIKGGYEYRIPSTNSNYILDYRRINTVKFAILYGFKL